MKQQSEIQIIYGTGNPAKLLAMKRWLEPLPVSLIGLKEAESRLGKKAPLIEETGNNPLENARLKARACYDCFKEPVFSCDSGLYLWNYETKQMLPEELQPGVCVRGRGEHRYTDEELLAYYAGLVKQYGPIMGRYQNAISMVVSEDQYFESEDESLWGEAFLLTDIPHGKRIPGFPIDSISMEIESGSYYYDLKGDLQDKVAARDGFQKFIENIVNTTVFSR